MEKKTFTFLNLAAQSPSLELAFAVSDKIQSDNKSHHTFYVCKSALKSCSVNIKHEKSICKMCVNRAKQGIRLYKKKNTNTSIKFISKKDLETFNGKFINESRLDEVKLGVNSTLASQFRIREINNLELKWKKYFKIMLTTSTNLYHYFKSELEKNKPEAIIVFNGRLSSARPIKIAAESTKSNYFLFDSSNNGKYPVLAKNRMFHSIEFVRDYSIRIYLNDIHKARITAANFMASKLTNKSIDDTVFTRHQVKKYIDPRVTFSKKKIISIYTSSDDEYRFIGSDWGQHKILDQVEEIFKLNTNEIIDEYQIVVKMHPNQRYIHKSDRKEYKKLSDKVLVLFPEDKTDTYELMKASEYVIAFCSLIAVEANYLRKKVIQIGPSIFMKLPVANYVSNTDDCIKLIKRNNAKTMPLRSSIIYFNYLSNPNCSLGSYKYVEDGVFLYNNERIQTNFRLRAITTFFKLIFNIQKGNFDFIENFSLYLNNFIKGERKVK